MSDSRTGFSILWKAAKSVGVDEVVGDIGPRGWCKGDTGGQSGEVGGQSVEWERWEGGVGEVGGWSGGGGRVE